MNIEGLKTGSSSSVSYIRDILEEHNMLLIVLTETWLREHLDAELAIQGYSIFRTDRDRRKKRRGRNSGGVAVFVRNDVNPQTEVLLHFSSGVIEALCLRMPILNLVLVAVYRQPNDSMGGNISTYVQFKELIEKLSETLNICIPPCQLWS